MIKFTCNFDFSPLLFPYGQRPKGSGVDLKVPSRRLICLSLTAGDLKVQAAKQIKIVHGAKMQVSTSECKESAAGDLKVQAAKQINKVNSI